MINNRFDNPIYYIAYKIRSDYRRLKRWSMFTLLVLPYSLIGIAYLVRSSGVTEWFEDNPVKKYFVIFLCLSAIISLRPFEVFFEYGTDRKIKYEGRKVNYYAFLGLIVMIFLLSLIDETSFIILYKSLIISLLCLLLYVNREKLHQEIKNGENTKNLDLYSGIVFAIFDNLLEYINNIKRDLTPLIVLFPLMLMMWVEEVILTGNDDGFFYIGYDSDSSWAGQLLVFGFICFSCKALTRCDKFQNFIQTGPNDGESPDEEIKKIFNKTTDTYLSSPRLYGIYLGVLHFLSSHSLDEELNFYSFCLSKKDYNNE